MHQAAEGEEETNPKPFQDSPEAFRAKDLDKVKGFSKKCQGLVDGGGGGGSNRGFLPTSDSSAPICLFFVLLEAFSTSFRQDKGAQTQTFGSGYFQVGWGGLPRECEGANKFGMSLETQENQTFWWDIPGF